jgi:DNA-binding transcriptional LysR family regulator
MDKRLLESFLAVYRSGSLVEAAERLNISQSALSRRITEFQNRLGVSLFEPSGRGMAATSDAHDLLPLASAALEGIAKLEAAARANSVQPAVHITVAATAHTIETVVAPGIAGFVSSRPNMRIGVIEANGVEIENLVLSGDASMGITGRPRYDTGLVGHPIVRLDILAAAPTPFTVRERRHGIDLRALSERDLLVLDRGYQSRLTLDAALRLLSLSPSIRHEGGSATVILALARAGLGTAVIPATTRTDLHAAKIIANGVVLGMDLAAIWDPALRWRAEVEQFAEALRGSFARGNRVRRGRRLALHSSGRQPR